MPTPDVQAARAAVASLYRFPEPEILRALTPKARLSPDEAAPVAARARALIGDLRGSRRSGWIERFLQEYRLSTDEGVALLGLAEAYLRVPDATTADDLIQDKLSDSDWRGHAGASPSSRVNTATLGLILTQGLLAEPDAGPLRGLIRRLGAPAVRVGVAGAMRIMGEQFVLGRDMAEALIRARAARSDGFRFSFDMLGEGARTAADARRYQAAYLDAIAAAGKSGAPGDVLSRDSVSVKLSALHCRYEPLQAQTATAELTGLVLELARAAKARDVGLTIDAEETERLEMSLDIIAAVAADPSLGGWDGLGLAVQAYQRRATAVIAWADALGEATGRRLAVRLVKGAYWDTEIKRAQELGLADYPVFTRKAATDVSYLACARAMLDARAIYPAFATHNALTVAAVMQWAGARRDFEFQRLHGMGAGLYERLIAEAGVHARVYAPVGGHRELLAYLVRRLLENGANSSFVSQLADPAVSDEYLLADPADLVERADYEPDPRIPAPGDMFAPQRRNSAGLDLSDPDAVGRTLEAMSRTWREMKAQRAPAGAQAILDPANAERVAGYVIDAGAAACEQALAQASAAQADWAERPVEQRAAVLDRAADLMEIDRDRLLALLVREAGKTLPDAVSEVREAVDFCRYYAAQARLQLHPQKLPGPTGEHNELRLVGRGVFLCISPWNFPLAIFVGQVAAALVAGNAVIAKPAPQTPLIARRAVELLHAAGALPEVLHLLAGGPDVGAALVADARIAGVAFTGSTATARKIARTLLEDDKRPLVALIAETGGINAMIVDSTALPEQVVADVVTSAFRSAGQRCSALRLLCLQEDVAAPILTMLAGAMAALRIGDPANPATDVGPVIDAQAQTRLTAYVEARRDRVIAECALPASLAAGRFVAPVVLKLGAVEDLAEEVFGPVLHVVTWKAGDLEALVDRINASGFGLTLGLHSRLASAAARVQSRAKVGNFYVNRSMIGAVVGVQPFGGEGLSGTGPKAGGPHYLLRMTTERTVSIDTTSSGGNASLLSLIQI